MAGNDVSQNINVLDESGQPANIPREQLNDALNQGYKVAQPQDIKAYENEQQYGSPTEMLKTFGEGAANAATFGGFRELEKAANVSPRGIIGREETNPVTYGLGQLAGLIGTSALGVGEGAALESAGNFGAKALGLGEQGLISKVGAGAVKGAIENSLFQTGSEIEKNAISDPTQTAGSAMANVGLSGLIGGGIGGGLGVVSPLWEATTGGRFKSFLDLVKNKAEGQPVPMESTVQDAVNSALNSGMEISPEIRASLSNDPEIRSLHAQLIDSSTKPGTEMKAARDAFLNKIQEHALTSLGATPEYMASLANKSDFQLAENISNDIMSNLKSRVEPISEGYEAFEKKAGNIPLTQEQDVLADKLGQYAINNRLVGRGNAGEDLYNFVMKRLPTVKDVTDLKNLQQDIWGKVYSGGIPDPQAVHFGSDLVKMVRGVEQDTVMRGLGEKFGPEVLDQFNLARANYSDMMQNTIDPLASRLNVGRYNGAKGFLSKLEEKFSENPERILRKLNPKDDANMIALLQGEFPEVGAKIRQYHLDEILSKAAKSTSPSKVLNKSVADMSPEMRNWLFTDGQQKTLGALETIRSQLTGIDHNFSGTAKASDVMQKHAMAGAMGMAAQLMGHNPIVGALLGEATRYLSRDLPDAMKLGFLKFLGSNAETNPKGFAAMTNYLTAVYKGEAKTSKAVKSLFEAGKAVIPAREFGPKDLEKIDKRIKSLQDDPSDMFGVGNDVAHYMPEHGAVMAQTASNAVNYLNSIRPVAQKSAPLDQEVKPTNMAQNNYHRALEIAQNPLTILHNVKDGSILPQDIVHLKTMFPGLYSNLSNKITAEITKIDHEANPVSYKTKMGLSAFLGTTLDSSLSPNSIMAAQNVFAQQKQAMQSTPPNRTKKNTSKMGEMSKSFMTAEQAAASRQSAEHS